MTITAISHPAIDHAPEFSFCSDAETAVIEKILECSGESAIRLTHPVLKGTAQKIASLSAHHEIFIATPSAVRHHVETVLGGPAACETLSDAA